MGCILTPLPHWSRQTLVYCGDEGIAAARFCCGLQVMPYVLKQGRCGDWHGRKDPTQHRHRQGGVEHRGPGEQAHGSRLHAKGGQSETCGGPECEGACCGVRELRHQIRGRLHGSRGDHGFSSFSAILRARRSSCLRLRTALSTIPRTSCSAEPPQKRSMIPLTARTATFCRASEAV